MSTTDELQRLFTSYGNAMYRNDPDAAEKIAAKFSAALAQQPAADDRWNAGYKHGLWQGQHCAPAPLTECHDTDSPWLVCKHCHAAGKCGKQPAASGEPVAHLLTHLYSGHCPDENQPHSRDPECRACRAMDAAPHPAPARVPLTEDALQLMALEAETPAWGEWWTDEDALLRFARAIEAHHDITAKEAP